MWDTELCGLLPNEICSTFNISPQFRGKQIFKWISSGVDDFNQMTNIPLELREKLSKNATLRTSCVTRILKDDDGTVKLQIQEKDAQAIETVLLIDKVNRKTACVSCQAGCGMKCAFCMTGTLGFARNLTSAEITEQFFLLEKETGKLDNIVFMGMGEPMLNLENIRKAIMILTHKEGRALSARRITLSTCGIIRGIYDLADNGPNIRLAISLTTANEKLRKTLMPVANANPLQDLREAIYYYAKKTKNRVTLEAALLGKTNTDEQSANELVSFAKDLPVHINLIPWNPVENLPFEEPTKKECEDFVHILEKNGINVTLRMRRGLKINGACGQLGKVEKNTG